MFPYFIESRTIHNGEIILHGLPFNEGDKVDIIFIKQESKAGYDLRGIKFKYIDPTEPIAEEDWEATK
jgi:hypothetical protein